MIASSTARRNLPPSCGVMEAHSIMPPLTGYCMNTPPSFCARSSPALVAHAKRVAHPRVTICTLCASEWYCSDECQHYDRHAHYSRTVGTCGVSLSDSDDNPDSCHSSMSAPAPATDGLLSFEELRIHGWAARRRSEPDLRALTYAFAPQVVSTTLDVPADCHRSQCEFRCSCRGLR